jgi:hypothetical protein
MLRFSAYWSLADLSHLRHIREFSDSVLKQWLTPYGKSLTYKAERIVPLRRQHPVVWGEFFGPNSAILPAEWQLLGLGKSAEIRRALIAEAQERPGYSCWSQYNDSVSMLFSKRLISAKFCRHPNSARQTLGWQNGGANWQHSTNNAISTTL